MIRLATQEDIPAILDIYGPYVLHTAISFEYTVPTPEEFTRRFLSYTAQFPWLVWEEEGEILGYAYGSAPFSRAAYQWCAEASAYIAPQAHRRGIGTKLYRALEQLLFLQGYQVIYCLVTTDNPGSVAFHEKLGYRIIARMPDCGIKFVEIPSKPPVSIEGIVKTDRNLQEVLSKMTLS